MASVFNKYDKNSVESLIILICVFDCLEIVECSVCVFGSIECYKLSIFE